MKHSLVIWAVSVAACGSSIATSADRDGDQVRDDRCPDEPEVYNGHEDEDGCPDRPPEDECMWEDHLHITARIAFDAGSVVLDHEELLQVIAETLVGNPSLERIAVVGAVAPGEPEALALRRAELVREALIRRGVVATRLEAHARPNVGEPVVWFSLLQIGGQLTRDEDHPDGDRMLPFRVDCEADRRAWEERGEMRSCDCVERQ